MRRILAAAALCALAAAPPDSPAPELADRLSWNARERTAAGVRALDGGDAPRAVAALDTALRLRPDDPVARYNAGTARIGVEPVAAAELLAPAAESAPDALAPDAWYNLGNARLAADDAEGAVESYVQALRRRPDHADTKFNLELALRRAEQQEKERQQQQDPSRGGESEDPGGGRSGQQQQRDGAGGDSPEGEQNAGSDARGGEDETEPDDEGAPRPAPEPAAESGQEDREGGAEPGEGEGEASARRDRPGPGRSEQGPLPRFRDLPDMNAEQAGAILRAVDDLERRLRRERAQKEARERARVEVDW